MTLTSNRHIELQYLVIGTRPSAWHIVCQTLLDSFLVYWLAAFHCFLMRVRGKKHSRTCPLPHMMMTKHKANGIKDGRTGLTINSSGTECYDHSSMGRGAGLTGPTCKTLACWLESRRRTGEDPGENEPIPSIHSSAHLQLQSSEISGNHQTSG